ncbi:MAG: hypothetical protein AAF740_11610 [Bacteroidota bacterium]
MEKYKLYEISDVTRAANKLTPYLGMKGSFESIQEQVFEERQKIYEFLESGGEFSEESLFKLSMQIRQLNAIESEMNFKKKSIKEKIREEQEKSETPKSSIIKYLI